jgi:4-hydroxybenzoate polyprenyltransferase
MAVKLNLFLQEHNIIFLRRFLFVFGLALIFDVRDIEKDKMAAMRTVATEYGVLATKAFAITALALFFLLTFLTPIASASIALSISAIMARLVVWQVKTSSSALYYLVAVDGLMIAQFLLILVWPIV